MPKFDEFFQGQGQEPWARHPQYRRWADKVGESPEDTNIELYRNGDALSRGPVTVYFNWKTGSGDHQEKAEWDDDLNDGLIRSGVRGATEADEIFRFALTFASRMKKSAFRFGDGFFNSVLTSFVRTGPFADTEPIKELLPELRGSVPSAGRSRTDCEDMIKENVAGIATDLEQRLRYKRDESERILSGALARYLDDRFHITARRQMGWT